MATHSSFLAWRIPWTEEPGRLQSMRSQRVRHDWVTFTFFSFITTLISLMLAIIYFLKQKNCIRLFLLYVYIYIYIYIYKIKGIFLDSSSNENLIV